MLNLLVIKVKNKKDCPRKKDSLLIILKILYRSEPHASRYHSMKPVVTGATI